MLDWDKNVDPEFGRNNKRFPVPVRDAAEMEAAGYQENWIVYSRTVYSAKELTVLPGRSVVIKDAAAYGLIVVEGVGSIGKMAVETPTIIRYAQMTKDELFVSAAAAKEGVKITNTSDAQPLVMLKHFGPGNPDSAHLVRQ